MLEKLIRANVRRQEHAVMVAQALNEAGKPDRALIYLDNLPVQDKNYPVMIGERIHILLDMGEIEQAEALVQPLLNEPRTELLGHSLAGDVAYAKKDWAGSIHHYSKVADRAVQGETLKRMANAYLYLGRGDEAIELLSNHIGLYPYDILWRHALADIYIQIGQLDQAMPHLVFIVDHQPSDVMALNNLGWIYSQRPETLSRALELTERAAALAPQTIPVLDTYGWILQQKGEVSQARGVYERIFEIGTRHPSIWYHYAVVLEKSAEQDQARDLLERVLASPVEFDEREDAQKLLETLPPKEAE